MTASSASPGALAASVEATATASARQAGGVASPAAPSAPKRIQLSRKKGWRKPEGAVVVSRPSRWGNPYRISELRIDYPLADERELRRMATEDLYGYLHGRWDLPEDLGDYPNAAEVREALAGRDLACWCPLDHHCHADVLLEVANSAAGPRPRRAQGLLGRETK